ncbi:AsmA family protein [Thiotrichales bacterium 19S3-7]|nr:AsmA family protein [Thiotrichales bacterium 19S3-7]MCF6801151.1 AsmA family protein [Thiotrichales bacterium 19S3-11]
MRLIRWFFYLLITIIILLFIGFGILWFSFDINHYKPQIERLVKQTTGRTLTLSGDIYWSFYGFDLEVDIGKGQLSNPQDQTGTFAQWNSADIHINPWPTISYYLGISDKKVIEINQISIAKASTFIQIDENGRNNLSFSTRNAKRKEPTNVLTEQSNSASPSSNKELFSKAQWLPTLTGKINLEHADITYNDLKNHQQFKIYDANLHIESDQKSPTVNLVHLNLATKGMVKKIPFDAHLTSLVSISAQDIHFKNVNAELTTSGNKQKAKSSLLITTKQITLSPSTLTTKALNLVINNLLYITISDSSYLFKDHAYYGHLIAEGENLRTILESFTINMTSIANHNAFNNPQVAFDFYGNKQSLSLKNVQGGLDDSKLSGYIKCLSFSPIKVNYSIDITPIRLSDYLDLKGAILTFNLLHSNGTVSFSKNANHELLIQGKNQINSPKAELKGIDINRIASDVQNLLKSVSTMNHFNDALNKIKNEMQTLNINNGRINPKNGLSTTINKIDIENQFKGNKIDTNKISLEGANFYLNGNGEYNLSDQGLSYKLKAFVYNPQTPNLEDYQKVYIPYHIWRKTAHDALQWRVNYNELFKQVQPIALQGLGKQLSDQLKNNKKLNDKINQFLNNL